VNSRVIAVRKNLLLASLLVLAISAAYVASLRGEFLWDDDLHITANPTIVGPLGLKEIWTSARANYFPLVLTNFWVQHALWGLEPFGYRVVTLAFHIGAALLLWRVLVQLRVPGAWFGAAFWALHPVQVESVAWICELKNTQSAVFFLAAVLFWLRWLAATAQAAGRDTAPAAEPGWRHYALALGCALLAILSKPSTVMLPVALGLCVWWARGRIAGREALRLAPFFALSAVAAGWTIWEQKFNSGAIGPEWNQSLAERFAIAGRAFWFYLQKLVWPEPLVFIYPRWDIARDGFIAYVGVIAALLLGSFLVWRARDPSVRPWLFATAYFVALLFPILGFFSVYFFRYSFVGDHFQYLASMGPLAFLAAGLAQLAPRWRLFAGAAVVVALTLATARHTRVFLSSELLWRDTVAKNPAAIMAWLNLADTLAQQERHDEAIATFRHALTLRPDDPYALNDLGCALTIIGRPAEGIPHLERSLAVKPNHAEAHNNLGNALRAVGRSAEAIAHYRRALEIRPSYTAALNNLGAELAESGRAEEALAVFERARELKATDAATLDNLGNALRVLGRFDDAIGRHREALALKPDFPEAHVNLARTLVAARRAEEALPLFERALALRPSLTAVHGHYALALAGLGRVDEALRRLTAAVERAPAALDLRMNLGAMLAQTGRPREALPHFEAAAKIAPDYAPAQMNLATAMAALERWPQAAEAFARGVALQPDSALARTQLAVALVNAGQLPEAVPHFEAALRLAPSAALHNQFGQVLRALGRNREALEQFEAAARR
jgi:tetratricopeptide (TPR) repeat protein